MAEYAYYSKLWQKAFLIEIIKRGSNTPERSFAFSLPPESVQVQIPQRVNVTKTFGGVFIDDYGLDVARIAISGNTGNSAIRQVYSDGRATEMDGKSEAYFVLEEIIQYKRNRAADYEKYELRLYDLSSVPTSTIQASSIDAQSLNIDGWIVVLKNGSISRSKDRPLYYNYSLEFDGIEPLGVKKYSAGIMKGSPGGAGFSATQVRYVRDGKESTYKASPSTYVKTSVNKIKNITPALKKALSGYKDFVNKVNAYDDKLDQFRKGLKSFYSTLQGFIDTTMGGVNSVYEKVLYPYDLVNDLVGAATNMRASFEQILPSLEEKWTNIKDKYTKIPELISSVFAVENETCGISAASKSLGLLPSVQIVPEGTPGSAPAYDAAAPTEKLDVSVLITYGSFKIVANSETRLDALALKIFGTPDYADMLASYNGISGDSEIVPGMEIRIPFLSYTAANAFNEVYNPDGDFYGADVALDDSADLQLGEFNDYVTVEGEENLAQAVNLRMAEERGARVRLDLYGIKMGGGGFDSMSTAIMISSVRESLLEDPRIKAVNGFNVRTSGDTMALSYSVETETGGTANFTTTV